MLSKVLHRARSRARIELRYAFLIGLLAAASCVNPDGAPADGVAGASGAATNSQALSGLCSSQSFSGHDYLFCIDLKTWDLARSECAGAGMDLARISSSAENDFVRSGVGLLGHSWIGANDQSAEGSWKWADNGQQFWQGLWNGSAT